MTTETKTHYHCESGLQGYGPDATDEGFTVFEDLEQALEAAREELSAFAEMAYEDAQALAESEDYESAWKELKRSEELETLRANFSTERKSAPLYVDNSQAWKEELERLADMFPLDVSHNARLYLWQCDEDCKDEDDF
jgi:hypothetical protein